MTSLKFKEIRKSIINYQKDNPNDLSPNRPPLKRNLFDQNQDP